MRTAPLLGIVFLGALAAGLARPQTTEPADPYSEHIAKSGPRNPEEERQGFHVPPGFEVQLVAAEPYVRKPINMNFDDRGRLWVTESVEYPFPAPPGAPHRDVIGILEDKTGDGRADEVTTFTDGLNIPIGVLPVTGGAIVYSIPAVQKLDDTDGDGRADRRHVLYGPYGHQDTHGMTGEFTWGFDGWIYACHGFSNTSEVRGADGSRVEMQSGNVYRFRPDGSRVEQWTHGQVNPFGLAFDPLGNLFSCDCHTRPVMQLLRNGYYQSFGKPHDGLGFAPEMMSHDHGSTAIAGIAFYAADHFPPAYRDTVFVGNVVTNRINHDRLERHGSTCLAIEQPDFLVSDDPWFRPVDIKLGPDGALYVADFYNRIIGHYEVPLTHPGRDRERGRIWRIVYRGTDAAPRPNPKRPRADWAKASVAELVEDLAHPNLTVRMKATNQLVERGGPADADAVRAVMRPASNPFQRMHGLWVLDRQKELRDDLLASAAVDPDPGVRVHAFRILAERRHLSPALHRVAVEGLKDTDAFAQRAAAEALGTHPSAESIRPLLDLDRQTAADDTHLKHMVRMALRDQLGSPPAWKEAAELANDERDARALADVAPGMPSRDAAAFLLAYLGRFSDSDENQLRYFYHVARYAEDASGENALALVRKAGGLKRAVERFRAVQQGVQARGGTLAGSAVAYGERLVRRCLAVHDEALVLAGIELSGALKTPDTRAALAEMAANRKLSEKRRTTALAALVAADPERCIPLLGKILADASEHMDFREKAAQSLAGIKRDEAMKELLNVLPTAPGKLAVTVAAGLARNPAWADKLLDAVEAGKASARILPEPGVGTTLSRSGAAGVRDRFAHLTADLPPPDQKLLDFIRQRRQGFLAARPDAALGQKVFEKSCAICHTIANKGAKIGPQLDGVGIRGVDRLLEDVLDPNRNVDQAFRLTTVTLKNGQMVAGLLLREEGEVLVLADAQGKEVRVLKKDVDERTLSQLSPMPANFGEQLSENDLYHLLAYLLTQRASAAGSAKAPAASEPAKASGRR